MVRTFKYRLYPTQTQERVLFAWLDATCELYNAALQERRDAWQKQKVSVSVFGQMNALPEIRATRDDFSKIPIVVLRGVLHRLNRAFVNFFRRCKTGEIPGHPRFKSRNRFLTISIDDLDKRSPIVAGGKRVHVPLLGKVKFKQHRPIEGRPKTMRLKFEAGRWYVMLACVDVPQKTLPSNNESVGVDLGLIHYAATSDGEIFDNPRLFSAARIQLERAQRRVTRRIRGSNRRRRAVCLLQRKHRRVANLRRENQITIAKSLVQNYDLICVEDLNIKGLSQGWLSKSVFDAGWSIFFHWLRVKAESAGREIQEVDPRGTSQRCSGCGVEVRKGLGVRIHDCPYCGLRIDRDVNAARNILAAGLAARRDATAVGVRR